MACLGWLLNLGFAGGLATTTGSFSLAAGEVYSDGIAVGEVYTDGREEGEVYVNGTVVGEVVT